MRSLCLIFFLLISSYVLAQQLPESTDNAATTNIDSSPDSSEETSTAELSVLISELAASSDLVAIAKVDLTSYKYRRGFPIGGFADLRILIPYKAESKVDIVRVRDSGLHTGECYFPATFPGQDGARFLVFLSKHPDGEYRGNPLTCKLSVLVTDQHRYALRYPFDGNTHLTEEQQDWVEKLNFSDPNAFAGTVEMTPGRKAALAAQIDGVVTELGVKYTKGLSINYFTDLLGENNLKRPIKEGHY